MAGSAGEPIVTDGLVLCLDAANSKCYAGSGTTATDLVQNAAIQLLSGAAYNTAFGGTFSFDAANSYLSLTGAPRSDIWTLNLWFGIIGPSVFTVAGHRTFMSTNTFRFQYDDVNTSVGVGPFIDFVAGGQARYSSALLPSDIFNKWHMVTVWSNGSIVKVYYDVQPGVTDVTGSRFFSTNGVVSIGLNNLSGIGAGDPLDRDGGSAYISHMSIYNRALSVAEIQQNFDATRSRYGL